MEKVRKWPQMQTTKTMIKVAFTYILNIPENVNFTMQRKLYNSKIL